MGPVEKLLRVDLDLPEVPLPGRERTTGQCREATPNKRTKSRIENTDRRLSKDGRTRIVF
jgi:hypothetical protein